MARGVQVKVLGEIERRIVIFAALPGLIHADKSDPAVLGEVRTIGSPLKNTVTKSATMRDQSVIIHGSPVAERPIGFRQMVARNTDIAQGVYVIVPIDLALKDGGGDPGACEGIRPPGYAFRCQAIVVRAIGDEREPSFGKGRNNAAIAVLSSCVAPSLRNRALMFRR